MTQNCSCNPLLKQLYGRHRSLLWARIRPFVYGSLEPIFTSLVHGGFTWIIYALSIIDEEIHYLQNILKKFYMLFLDLFTELSSHRCGSVKLIWGSRMRAHIDHNISYSCRCSRRDDISTKSEIMIITFLKMVWDTGI